MFKVLKKEIEWGGQKLTLETGKIARQADGAVIATLGETVVMACAVAQKTPKDEIDFMPLTVSYREMAFAAGKIPGGFFKREGRPAEREVLISRLIDRPLRPLFVEGFCNETQVVATLLSYDKVNKPDVLAMIACSAALMISGIPLSEAVGCARVGYENGEFVLNPHYSNEVIGGDLDLLVAGTKSSVLMVESEAKELSEELMLEAVNFGHKSMQPVIDIINELKEEVAKEVMQVNAYDYSKLKQKIKDLAEKDLIEAYSEKNKQARLQRISEIQDKISGDLVSELEEKEFFVNKAFKDIQKDIVRKHFILSKKVRIDGRNPDQIRDIESEVKILPRTHGSALFTRGETQAVAVATLGASEDSQIIDALDSEYKERFLMHYNFPPYSVGEASPMRPAGRREIGHGKLAWRALKNILPQEKDFPYTIRLVSEITESNGSSSMATICASSLAMLDAGVPIKSSVAGIAMGLVKEKEDYVVLSDIMGDEDYLGDMDFKVAGTKKGITALQMDIKINGINIDIMQEALKQAHDGRMHILGKMSNALQDSRDSISEHAPRITSFKVDTNKIREIIGAGGKVIKSICEESGAKVEIEDDGTVKIISLDGESYETARNLITSIVSEPEIGKIYDAKVVKLVDFGAFVSFFGKKEGLVHISEISIAKVESVEKALTVGQEVKVKLLAIDNRGKIRLSMRSVDQETGDDISGQFEKNDKEVSKTRENQPKKSKPIAKKQNTSSDGNVKPKKTSNEGQKIVSNSNRKYFS